MGMVRDIVEAKGAILVGQWSTEGYDFEASKGMADDNRFGGLGIDEDRQPELTGSRVKAWCKQIHDELSGSLGTLTKAQLRKRIQKTALMAGFFIN